MTRHFVDDRHALYAGWVFGAFMRAGLYAECIIDEDKNYTDRLVIELRDRTNQTYRIELVVPPPPDDWTLQ